MLAGRFSGEIPVRGKELLFIQTYSVSLQKSMRPSPKHNKGPETMKTEDKCSVCTGSMDASDMKNVSKDEIEEAVSNWKYHSGGWVCRRCGYPVTTEQLKEADPL